MSILDLFKSSPLPYSDPHLGVFQRSGPYWQATIVLPPHGTLPLSVVGSRAGPDEAALILARELPVRFESLLPALQNALVDHYRPYQEAVESGEFPDHPDPFPAITGPLEILSYVKPERVLIDWLAGVLTIEIAYQADWDIEHTLGARIQKWTVVELCGSVQT